MRIEANKDTLASIRNLVLRAYAERYVNIERDFMDQIRLPKTLFFFPEELFSEERQGFWRGCCNGGAVLPQDQIQGLRSK